MTLDDLIQDVQKKGGFSYYTTHPKNFEGQRGQYYQAFRGFKENNWSELARKAERLWIGSENLNFLVNKETYKNSTAEAVSYHPIVDEVKVGERLFSKNPILEKRQLKTKDLLSAGTDENAIALNYGARRVEKELNAESGKFDGRPGTYVVQGLVIGENQFNEILNAIKSNPNNAKKLFNGTFPDWEKMYHVERNGKMVILPTELIQQARGEWGWSQSDISALRRKVADKIQDYQVEG